MNLKWMNKAAWAISTAAVVTAVASSAAQGATANQPYPRLVALGDSITFGYNLDPRNLHVSKQAYPFLIGRDDHYQVRDLGVPGWTSADLRNGMQSNRYMQESIRTANVITVDIGSNDVLGIAVKDGVLSSTNLNPQVTAAEKAKFMSAISQFGMNLAKIVGGLHSMAPQATIVLYNLYNPIPSMAKTLNALAEEFIGAENQIVAKVAATYQIPVADAYSAFEGKQATLVRLDDVHPTVAGQEVLATVGEATLQAARAPVGN